jgi:hypothetical protein
VERELTVLASIKDPALRQRRLDLDYEDVQDDVNQITASMREHHFGELALGKFCAVMQAIPGVSPAFGLANALYNLLQGAPAPAQPSPFAYAAYAQAKLLSKDRS